MKTNRLALLIVSILALLQTGCVTEVWSPTYFMPGPNPNLAVYEAEDGKIVARYDEQKVRSDHITPRLLELDANFDKITANAEPTFLRTQPSAEWKPIPVFANDPP